MSSPQIWGGGVNLTVSTPSGAVSKEVVSADYVGNKTATIETTLSSHQEILNICYKKTVDDNANLSGIGMPSSNYIDSTLGASGSTYTAPANGYFVLQIGCSGNNKYLLTRLTVAGGGSDVGFCIPIWTGDGSIPVRTTLPCRKDSIYLVLWNCDTSGTPLFRFVYAEGASQ